MNFCPCLNSAKYSLLGALTVLFLSPAELDAGVTAFVAEFGGDVIATGSGTLNVTDLSQHPFLVASAAVVKPSPSVWQFGVGPSSSGGAPSDGYGPVIGPATIGPSTTITQADVQSGDITGLNFFTSSTVGPFLVVPKGYVSSAPLSFSNTFIGESFTSLGVTPGSYTWTWGTTNPDFFTIHIGIPEPSTFSCLMMGIGLMGLPRCRGRKR